MSKIIHSFGINSESKQATGPKSEKNQRLMLSFQSQEKSKHEGISKSQEKEEDFKCLEFKHEIACWI
jgi:hypothetical protein